MRSLIAILVALSFSEFNSLLAEELKLYDKRGLNRFVLNGHAPFDVTLKLESPHQGRCSVRLVDQQQEYQGVLAVGAQCEFEDLPAGGYNVETPDDIPWSVVKR